MLAEVVSLDAWSTRSLGIDIRLGLSPFWVAGYDLIVILPTRFGFIAHGI